MAVGTIKVEGLRSLQRASTAAGKETAREVTRALKESAGPVQATAQRLALASGAGTRWSRMRIGATSTKVYVAPASRRRGGSPRPNFAGRLMGKALLPALAAEEDETVRRFESALDRIGVVFEKGR